MDDVFSATTTNIFNNCMKFKTLFKIRL